MKRNPVMKYSRLFVFFCFAMVFAALVILANIVPALATPSPEVAPSAGSRQSINDIPLSARYAVSKAIGKDREAYHVVKDTGGLHADNPNQSYGLSFSPNGFEVRSGKTSWGLRLKSWGYGANQHPVSEAQPIPKNNRVDYKRGALTEWYVNGPYGLQQGFTLQSPPGERPKGAFLRICLERLGGLKADVDRDRCSLSVYGHDGATLFRYGGLTVIDANGRELKAWLDVDTAGLNIAVDDSQARYPLTIDPFVQTAKLTASDGEAFDEFGGSVAVSGDTIVVGAIQDDMLNGSAYVFVKPAGGWADMTQTAKLTASDTMSFDEFGGSVAVSGDTIVVGAVWGDGNISDSGSAYVFVKPGGGWAGSLNENAELLASDGKAFDEFGGSVAVNGDTIVVGATLDNIGADANLGSAYVFVKPGGGWAGSLNEDAKLTASDGAEDDQFGCSVAVNGDTIVVGADDDDDNASDSGSAYVFVKPGGGWAGSLNEDAKLTASDGAEDDQFGCSVAVSGDTIVVGADDDDDNGNSSGSAYVFVKPGGGWTDMNETAKLTASDGAEDDQFGCSVSVSGDTIAVGAIYNDDHGSAYVFITPDGGWATTDSFNAKLTASDAWAMDWFGCSVAVSGDTAVVGAFGDDDNGFYSGSAYFYRIRYTLSALRDGTGSGTVVSSPEGIDCPGVCDFDFVVGKEVTLTAEPDPGSALDDWTGADCPGNGNCTLTMDQDYTVTATFNTDNDGDGISNGIEDAGPNGGDGNDDHVQDSQQQNVTTFQDIYGQWCTLTAILNLKDVFATVNPSPADMPSQMNHVVNGFFGFTVGGLVTGATVNVTLILHDPQESFNDYWKYGPTQTDPTDHWYNFLFNGTNGADIARDGDRTVITLHLTDGGPGDDDLTADGSITCNYLAGVSSAAAGFLPAVFSILLN